MANIELPKDAEGREIPLDTTSIFGVSGKAYNIVRWEYITGFDAGSQTAHKWYGITEFLSVLEPEKLLLTPPDSWEKLEEDLDRCIAGDNICLYCSPSGRCSDCAHESNGACDAKVLELVMERIKRLRGED
jgi:hypothetical protein